MNKIVIAAVIALIVGVGLWFVFNNSDSNDGTQTQETNVTDDSQTGEPNQEASGEEQSEPENTQASEGSVEVTYTVNGFEPREITINAGDTVTWTNQSGSAMQVASDDHPEHLDYPGFDQLSPGDSYSFTFDEPGTWGYHNHEDHNVTGLITVN